MIQLLPDSECVIYLSRIPPGERPFTQYWPEFCEKYLRTGKSEVTVRGVKDALKFAIRQLDILTIEQLNSPRLVEEALFAYKAKTNIKDTTFNSYRKNFITFCIWLRKMQYINENNMKLVDKCKEVPNEQLIITAEQIEAMMRHVRESKQLKLEQYRNLLFLEILAFTGARPCEMLNIRVRDLKIKGKDYILQIHGKKQKGRIRYYKLPFHISYSFLTYMARRSQRVQNDEFLFVSMSRKSKWTEQGMRRLFSRLSDALRFEVTAYAFRRYVATKLYLAGVPLKQIGDYLGHTRESTTRLYVARCCALTKDCSDIMERVNGVDPESTRIESKPGDAFSEEEDAQNQIDLDIYLAQKDNIYRG